MSTFKQYFRAIDVWEHLDGEQAVRYRCFQNVVMNTFSVQSADHYRQNTTAIQHQEFEKQFLDLFLEERPDIRSASFPTIEEAIENFKKGFDGL